MGLDDEDQGGTAEASALEGAVSQAGSLVFDRSILDELAEMLDREDLLAYLALVEPTVRPRAETLLSQLEAGDVAGLLLTAHALAGGSACYGLVALSAAAREIENGARVADLAAMRRAIIEVQQLVERSLAAVADWWAVFGSQTRSSSHLSD